MPYVVKSARVVLDEAVTEVTEAVQECIRSREGRDGCLNFTISSIINTLYDRNYADLNAAIGVLECIKLELYRRVVAPYEDTKIIQNGDVY